MKTKKQIQDELDLVFGKGTKNVSTQMVRKKREEKKNVFVEDFNYYEKLATLYPTSLYLSNTSKLLLKNAAERLKFTPKQFQEVSFLTLQINSLEKPIKSRLDQILTVSTAKAIQLYTFLKLQEPFTNQENKNDFIELVNENWYKEVQKISDGILPKNPLEIINTIKVEPTQKKVKKTKSSPVTKKTTSKNKKEVSAKELITQIKSLQTSTLSKETKYVPKTKISTSLKPLKKSDKDIRDGRIKSDWLANGREANYWRDNPPRLILNPNDKSFRQGINLPNEYIKNAYDFELLKKMFGVKGFEFGRWTNYEDRYNYLVGLSAALYDLAETLSIPKTKIGLNLGIAFGARGASKALAHYEPYNHVINLTRFKGVERVDNYSYQKAFLQSGGMRSLTHEWGHAFDYYVGGGANKSLSNGSVSLHQIPFFSTVGLVGLMKNVLLKLCYKDKEGKEKSDFAQRVLDTESEYYARCNEIFARSFEVYVYLKMKQKGYFNVFLAKGKYEDDGKLTNKFSKRVYPTENEMRNVMKDFDLLISKMKQKL